MDKHNHQLWGPGLWRFLHSISFNYIPSSQKSIMKMFLQTLCHVIPCDECRLTYTTIYNSMDDSIYDSKLSLSSFIYDLHNSINLYTGKKMYKTYAAVERMYMHSYLPTFWGPGLWSFLHTISVNYPLKPSKMYKYNCMMFFDCLATLIPCEVCREHYIENIKSMSIYTFNSRELMSKFIYDLHNKVNLNTNKKMYKTYEFVYKKYLLYI
jgi:hypothetical protein